MSPPAAVDETLTSEGSDFVGNNDAGEPLGIQREMWDEKQIARYYASFAADYDNQIECDQGASYPSPFKIGSWAVEWLVRNHHHGAGNTRSSQQHIKILDLGCGTGQSGVKFREHSKHDPNFVYHMTGMDASPEMLEKARKRAYDELLVHNLESYPFDEQTIPPASFSVIVCVGVMDFIVGPRAFLKYIRGLLKPSVVPPLDPSGAETTSEPQPQAVLGITLPERHSYSDLSSFTRMEMEQLLRSSGYWIERHERFIGYRDSQTGRVQYYHGWLCTLAA